MFDNKTLFKLGKSSAIKIDEKKSDSFVSDIQTMIDFVSIVEKIDIDQKYYDDGLGHTLNLIDHVEEYSDSDKLLSNVEHTKIGNSYSISLLIDN